MDHNLLKTAIVDQYTALADEDAYVERDVNTFYVDNQKVVAIIGVRRCGKSTLLKQIAGSIDQFYYLNFEDERLMNFSVEDFNVMLELFIELYGDRKFFYFDEIQNITGWELFVRRMFTDGKKLYITGSSARLLSSELATSLTGRHLQLNLYPFSFKEFLAYHQFASKEVYSTKERGEAKAFFYKYLEFGGFPELVKHPNKDELVQIYQDVLIKDLIVRFGIREVKAFRELALYLLSNIATPISYNNLQKMLGFKSVNSVRNYIGFLEDAFMFFSVNKYDVSVRKQIVNDRKMYVVDTGLYNAISFKFSDNMGRQLENLVFIELKRRGEEIFYHRGKSECDFVLRKGIVITHAIQVTENMSSETTRERELKGLAEAMKTYQLTEGLILTADDEQELTLPEGKVVIKPIWKWLLG